MPSHDCVSIVSQFQAVNEFITTFLRRVAVVYRVSVNEMSSEQFCLLLHRSKLYDMLPDIDCPVLHIWYIVQ